MWTLLSESNVLHAASKECIFSKSLLQKNHQISSRVFCLTQADLFDSLLIQISSKTTKKWCGAGLVICLERGADLHMAQLMPLTVSCFSKIQIGFTFLVPAHPGSPGKGPLSGCLYVCMWVVDAHLAYVSMCCSKLMMCIEPNGPDYEVMMKAKVERPQQLPATALLSDRHFLEFGGLSLGQSAYVTNIFMFFAFDLLLIFMPAVLWRCWLGDRKGIWAVKNWVVECWRGYLSGAQCRLAYGPVDATATDCLLFQ